MAQDRQDADRGAVEATKEEPATESLPDASPTEDAVASEASAEEAKDTGTWRGEGDPPKGYEIKGKDGSKLYHRPDSSMFGRTKADVWFDSEAAAQAAGFTAAKTHPKEPS